MRVRTMSMTFVEQARRVRRMNAGVIRENSVQELRLERQSTADRPKASPLRASYTRGTLALSPSAVSIPNSKLEPRKMCLESDDPRIRKGTNGGYVQSFLVSRGRLYANRLCRKRSSRSGEPLRNLGTGGQRAQVYKLCWL